MLYSSCNGCLFYYDRVLYGWRIAEPTMLFLLGFEAATTYDKSASDGLIISKQKYLTDKNEVAPFDHYEIFEDIYNYLSQLGSIEDLDTYIKYNCYGLKLLLNEMTGVNSDRTVPIIFKNDINKSAIDLTSPMYRVSDNQRLSMSYYDLQAQKIHDIFEDASYNAESYNKIIGEYPSIYESAVAEYNKKEKAIHEEKNLNSRVYKLLDYKSMYSYSLGVLYGCRCLGCDPIAIWRLNPIYWYNGQYINLVLTAWETFRFHYTSFIEDIDDNIDHPEWPDKYKGIVINRLWNYGDSPEIDHSNDPDFMIDESTAYVLSIKQTIEDRPWGPVIEDSESIVSAVVGEEIDLEQIIYSERLDGALKIDGIRYYDNIVESPRVISFTLLGYNIHQYDEFTWNFIIDNGTTDITVNNIGSTLYLDPEGEHTIQELRQHIINALDQSLSISIEIFDKDGNSLILTEPSEWPDPSDYYPGKYLNIDTTSETSHLSWLPISNKVNDDPKTGIVTDISNPIVRYISNNPVIIYKAYQWQDSILDSKDSNNILTVQEDKYLSPNNEDIYFVATGCLGWVDFDENLWRYNSAPANSITLGPIEFTSLPASSLGYALDRRSNTIVSYYKAYVSSDDYLYGIFDGMVKISEGTFPDNKLFKSIISDDVFTSCFTEYFDVSGYKLEEWYNVDESIHIQVKEDSHHTLMWDGDDVPTLISKFGYTPTPAIDLDAYTVANNSLVHADLRKYRYTGPRPEDYPPYWNNYAYWSSTWASNNDLDNWRDTFSGLYVKNGTTSLYRGSTRLVQSIDVYLNSSNSEFIFDDDSMFSSYTLQLISEGSSSLYNIYGITKYLCVYITEDDDGNSLLDEHGNPLVWYDQHTNLYWNGVHGANVWQSNKPKMLNATMYNAETHSMVDVYDNQQSRQISINSSSYMSYEEFYSDPRRGIIRDVIKVFNPDVSDDIVDCYVDSKLSSTTSDSIYCILSATEMTRWVPREDLLSVYGYWIVDGTETLYDGDDIETTVFDDYHID